MSATPVQTATDTIGPTLTATFDTVPAAGKVITAYVGSRGSVTPPPSPWVLLREVAGTAVVSVVFARISDGTFDSVSVSVSDERSTLVMHEWDGLLADLDNLVDASSTNSADSVTSLSTGTAAATVDDGVAYAVITPRSSVGAFDNAWTNGFGQLQALIISGNRSATDASRLVDATGNYETTESWTSAVNATAILLLLVAETAEDTFTSGSNLVQATVLPPGNQFLKLDGPSEAGYAETPHSAQVHIPGDIDIRWFGAAESWDSPWNSDRQQLVSKGVFGERAYKLSLLSSSAVPRFRISPDGSAFTFADASEAFTHPDGEFLGIRVTWRQSDGRVQFFTSTDDGDTWDQLGTDQTISQPSINNEGDIWIGYDEWSAFSPFEGRVQRVEIRDGIDGTIVASPDFTTTGPWEPGDDSTTPARDDNQSNPWSLEGNAVIGADVVAQIHQGLPAITQTTDVAMRVLVVMG